MFAFWSLLLAAPVFAVSSQYHCTQTNVSVDVSLQATKLNITPPASQTELTDFVMQLTSATSNVSSEVVVGKVPLQATYDIWTQLCVPAGFSDGGLLEFAIHGINFDHSYWTFGGENSQYNYVESALKAGHAIFIYDRLGTGLSSKPDGIKDVQAPTEVAVAAALVKRLRNGTSGHKFGKIVGVGHSFGSIQLVGLAAQYGNLVDALVLTGFSAYTQSISITFAGWGIKIASEQNPARFGSLSSSYLATEGISNDQLTFFYHPEFAQSSLETAEEGKGTYTLGEILTLTEPTATPATNYTGSVVVVTGDKDYIFCGGNCYQSINGSPNLLEPVHSLFPSASAFSVYIPAGTGHGVNQHFSAPETFEFIEQWISKV